MTTQEYLGQISRCESMIKRKLEEINSLDIMIHGINSVAPDPNKVQTSLKGDKLSESVAKLVDEQNELLSLVEEYREKKKNIISKIDNMPNRTSYEVLTDKYVGHKSFCEIAYGQKCTERWAKKQHNKAIREFEAQYGAEYLDMPTIFSE